MPRPVLLVLLAALLTPTLSGCKRSDDQHYARALAIERELLRQNVDIGYDDRGYLHVMRQLDQVPSWSPDRERAEDLMSRISDARRIALIDIYPEQVSHLPARLEGREAPAPPRTDFSRNSAATAGTDARPGTGTRRDKGQSSSAMTGLTDEQKGLLQITMYSTAWCGYCRKARRWFNDNGYPFVEKDIEKSADARAEFREVSGGSGGVPLIVVNGQSFRGFNQRALLRRIRAVLKGV